MPEPLIAVIVITHNSDRWLPGFFQSLAATMKGTGVAHEVVVADAGSAVLPTQLPAGVRVMACGNVGYGASINRGVAGTAAPWLLLCNPDLYFNEDFGRD